MRDGYKVIDMDTHVVPPMEVLEKYVTPSFRTRLSEFDPYRHTRVGADGVTSTTISVAPRPWDRFPGTAPREEDTAATAGGRNSLEGRIRSLHRKQVRPDVNGLNSEGRLMDMDLEGRDIDFIYPGPFARAVTALEDVTLGEGLYEAYHRYMRDYTAIAPDRLKSAIQVTGADVEWAVSEIKLYGNDKWVGGVWLHLPEGLPVDHPDLDPIWATMNDLDLPFVHHTFQTDAPYFPGYRDMWGSVVAVRSAAHPWGAQRLFAYFIISGLFDRYPNLRAGVAEAGFGWLPSFLLLLGFTKDHLPGTTPTLKYTPMEYAQMGRVRPAADPLEGPAMTKAVIDIVGEDCVMYESDYPHPQAMFPDTAKEMIDFPIWKELGEGALRKLMSGNAEKFLRLAA